MIAGGQERFSTILAWLVVGGLAVALALGFLVPMYTDEIMATVQLARPLAEGGRLITLLPQCRSTWISPLPLVWFPASALYWVVFTKLGLLGYRISSLIMAAGWLATVAWFVARTTKRRDGQVRRFAMFAAPHALGVIPLALVTARPEPMMTLALCAYIAMPLVWSSETRRTTWGRVLLVIAFFLVTSLFTFVHSKALLFCPFIVVSAWMTFSWRRPVWLVLTLMLLMVTIGESVQRARHLGACPEAPRVAEVVRSLTIDRSLALREPGKFFAAAVENVADHARDITTELALDPPRPWLPHGPPSRPPLAVRVADGATAVLLGGFLIGAPSFVMLVTVRAFRRRRARAPLALAVSLLGSVFAHLVVARNWNFYSSPLVITSFALAAALAASVAHLAFPARRRVRARPFLLRAAVALQIVVVANVVTTVVYLGPRLVELAQRDGTIVPGQPADVPVFDYAASRAKIRAHAARCGIEGDHAKRLVIDDATLFAFEDLKEPLHIIYVSDDSMWGPDLAGYRNVRFLEKMGASGIISRCAFFPTKLLSRARRANDYCCVSASDLLPPKLPLKSRIVFAEGGNAEGYTVYGWSWPEEKGRWSLEEAALAFGLEGSTPQGLNVEVYAPLGGSRHSADFDFLLNGALLGTLHIDESDNDSAIVRRLPIPASVVASNANDLMIRSHDARPPREIGASAEDRPLGVYVRTLWLD